MRFNRFLLFLLAAKLAVATAHGQEKPNIVLIFADDLGYYDCGFTGSTRYETPSLDKLAKEGMVFNNAYAAAGNCAPSRAALMSGYYGPRHGVYAVGSTTRGPKELMRVVPVPNTHSLRPSFETMAEALKKQGYATGLFGKWHLGNDAATAPTAQGFDVYFDSRYPNPNKKRDIPGDPKSIFSLTAAAVGFMKENKGKPFFTFLSHHAIHGVQEARAETVQRFREKGLNNRQALYAACIYDFDESVGRVMDFLKSEGLLNNTLVLFTSDNGATPHSPQEPLRGNKGCYYEGGIRVPFFACWPGKIKPGIQNNTPVINIDLYPTFLAIAGNSSIKMDGTNILPLFLGAAVPDQKRSLYWHFPGYLDDPVIRGRDSIFRTRPVSVVRKGDWKLHLYHEEWVLKHIPGADEGIELYNLSRDPGERNNLAISQEKKKKELLNDLLTWMQQVQAPLPVPVGAEHPLNNNDEDSGAE